ncbi:MAG: hypothetical protein MRK00_00195 [Nitrosomonas sp.]|nr:hypothetical protein [Nitrosomonas sp.]
MPQFPQGGKSHQPFRLCRKDLKPSIHHMEAYLGSLPGHGVANAPLHGSIR